MEGLRGQVKSLTEAVVALEGRLRDSEKKFRHDKRYSTHTPHIKHTARTKSTHKVYTHRTNNKGQGSLDGPV